LLHTYPTKPAQFALITMAATNQAVVVKAFDAAAPTSGASLQPQPAAAPGAGEVQVQMKYAGVNPSDVFSLMGVYPGFTTKLPAVAGFDGELHTYMFDMLGFHAETLLGPAVALAIPTSTPGSHQKQRPAHYPQLPCAGMGTITAVGAGVMGLSPGQRVTAMGWQANEGQGSWQQYVNIKAEFVVGALPVVSWLFPQPCSTSLF
jgi:NADPH:quinone reductase-like Zn-dependent oxidoreductase